MADGRPDELLYDDQPVDHRAADRDDAVNRGGRPIHEDDRRLFRRYLSFAFSGGFAATAVTGTRLINWCYRELRP